MRNISLSLIVLCAAAAVLAGCPCGGQALPVTVTPLEGGAGYALEGPYDFEGTLTPSGGEWQFEGTFAFTSSGYTVLGPDIQVRESFPEQVTVTLRVMVPRPGAVLLPVITEVPVSYRIAASSEATFTAEVREYCWSPVLLAE